MPEEQTDAEKAEAAKAADAKKAEEEAAAKKKAETSEWDEDRAKATILKQRESEKELKDKLKAAEAKAAELDKIKEKDLSEQEKLAKQAKEALEKADAADSKLRRANLIAALANPDLGLVNARAAAKLIEGVEFDEEGEPTNLGKPDEEDSLLAKFLSENEYLRGKAAKPKPPGLDGNQGGSDTPPDLTADELEVAKSAGMSPEEYAIYKTGGSLADLKEAGLKLEETKT